MGGHFATSLHAAKTNKINAGKLRHSKQSSNSHSDSSASSSTELQYDYVIVGGGTAGCALAAKLSDPDKHGRYKNSVLVLEAGSNLTKDPRILVNNIFEASANVSDPDISSVDLTYLLGREVNPYAVFAYTQGKQWGGSSGHNYLHAVRGTPSIYNQWAAITGDARWSYDNLLNNVMIPMEHYTPTDTIADPSQRGSRGPLFITQYPPLDGDSFYQAVSTATHAPLISDYNNPDLGDVGISATQNFITPPYSSGVRSYAANAYLTGEPSVGVAAIVDAKGNGLHGRKLKIISNAYANRVLFSKKKVAKSVEYVLSDAKEAVFTAKAKKQIILCTGTFEDPAILQRSGIGDATLLNSLHIPVVFANSNVGNHMTCQFGQHGVIGGAETTINIPEFGGGFIGFAPTFNERIYQLVIINGLPLFPSGIANALGITQGIDVVGGNITPGSTGNVAIVSRDPFTAPIINFDIFSDGPPNVPGTDANKVISFYNTLQDIAIEAGGTVLYPTPDQYAAGDFGLMTAAADTLLPFNHASGSCRMAASAADGVVDGKLSVFGVKNLKIASNSIAPVIEDGNTAYSAYVIGLEAARIIRSE